MTQRLSRTVLACATSFSLFATGCAKSDSPNPEDATTSVGGSPSLSPEVIPDAQMPASMTPNGAPTGSLGGSAPSLVTNSDASISVSGGTGGLLPGDAGLAAEAGSTPPAVDGGFVVLCQDESGGQTETPQFSLKIYLLNMTDEDVPVEGLSLRYFFTADQTSATDHRVFIDHAGPGVGGRDNVMGLAAELEPPHSLADTYLELAFGAGSCGGEACLLPGSGTLAPNLSASVIKLRVQIQPTSLRYNLENDYSYTPEAREPSPCSNLVLYYNEQILFGVQPDGRTVSELPADSDAGAVDAGPSDRGASDAGEVDASMPQGSVFGRTTDRRSAAD